jgi:Ca2+/H+ antiporter, TMEM165/GDT1 family
MTDIHWAHSGPSFVASFLACLVECVEALTVVLAVGSVRSWSGALSGTAAAVAVLFALIAALGNTLIWIPLHSLQLVVGALLLLFGLRWLRKAILRSSGQIPLHDEQAAFAKNTASMERLGGVHGWDRIAFAAAFQITMLEGIEVVFIVIAIGSGGAGLLLPASVGAAAALCLVAGLGFALHRPLSNVPENKLKFVVGILLSAFGTFWVGEGIGLYWPGQDWSIVALVVGYLATAVVTVRLCRTKSSLPGLSVTQKETSNEVA